MQQVIVLSEISQSQKDKYMILCIWDSENSQIHKTEDWSGGSQELGEGEVESYWY